MMAFHDTNVDYLVRPTRFGQCTLSRLLVPVVTATLLLGTTAHLHAQESSAPLELDPVGVVGTMPSLTVPTVEGARDEINRTPGGVDLVPAEDFREQRVLTPKDMLEYVPGVFAQPDYGEASRLSIRGSGLALNFQLRGIRLMQDGVPFNLADGFGDFQQIDPLSLRYAEVFKGANALEHGATTPGGAINLISPTGRDAHRLLVRGEAGSFDFRRAHASSGEAIGPWDYFLTGSFLDQDGFRDHSGQESARFNANVGRQFGGDAETRLYFSYNNIDQELPGSLSRTEALSDPSQAAPRNIANNFKRDIESFRLSNKSAVLLSDTAEVSFGAFYVDKELDHPIFRVIDNQTRDYGGFTRIDEETTLFGQRNSIAVGTNLHAGTNQARQFVNEGGARGDLVRDLRQRAFNIQIFGENRYFVFPDLALIAGGQFAYATRETKDRMPENGDLSNRDTFTVFSPKVGVLWDVEPDWQVFGNVSRSTEVPTFVELTPTAQEEVTDIDATRYTTVEIGTRGERPGFAWDLAAYRSWVRDEIQLFDLGDGRTVSQNADRTIHQGIELGLQANVVEDLFGSDRISIRQAYTFNDFKFDDDPAFGDNRIPGIPRHFLRSELLYEHARGFYLGPNVEWVPEAPYVDNANTVTSKSYALLGFRAGYDFQNGLSLFVDGRNLTDENFISHTDIRPEATAEDRVFNPGDGLAVNAGVQFRW